MFHFQCVVFYCFGERHYNECCCTKYCYSECMQGECHYADCQNTECYGLFDKNAQAQARLLLIFFFPMTHFSYGVSRFCDYGIAFVLVQEDETKNICQQFMKHHIANCMEVIVKDVRVRLNVQRAVFKG